MEGWDPTEERHQIIAWAGVGVAGDAGVAQGQQGRFLDGEERLGKKKWLDSPSARPLLLTGIFYFLPNRIILVLLGSDIPIK